MALISAIEPQRRKGRYNIFVDGDFVIGVGEPVIARLGLRTGMSIEPERLLEVGRAEELQRAMDSSGRLLEIRPRSTREVSERLRLKGYDDQIIDEAVAKLTALGFLDDAQFSRQWVDSRTRANAAGARRMRSELLAKGVDKSVVDNAVQGVGEHEELSIAAAIVAKKLPNPSSEPGERSRQLSRIIALLQRRGLGWGIIKQATAHIRTGEDIERE